MIHFNPVGGPSTPMDPHGAQSDSKIEAKDVLTMHPSEPVEGQTQDPLIQTVVTKALSDAAKNPKSER